MEPVTDKFPVVLDPNTAQSFIANGVTYHIEREGGLSIARDRWLEKLGLYSLLGRDAAGLLKESRRAYDAVNNGKLADAAVILDNLMKGAGDLEAKHGPIYYVCTLFVNREGEDRTKYEINDARRKVADWETEGIERSFFFGLGTAYLSSTADDLGRLILSFSGGVNLSPASPNLSLSDES